MPARVTFASARPKELRAEATLPKLLDRMLARWALKKRFKGKRVAVKMHLGYNVGYSTISPLLVRRVVDAVTQAGGKCFVTDVPGAVATAAHRGYTAEVLGAPLAAVAGPADKYVYPRRVNYRTMKAVNLAGNIVDADAMIVLSHGKGHGQSGFGGAIKNIAMGCVDGTTRGRIHRLMSAAFQWDRSKCTGCLLCRDNCPNQAITYRDGQISIFDHACKYCMHCVLACPQHAITIDQRGYRWFQRGMALTVREALKTFQPGRVLYVTVLLQVTPFCDCWGFTTPSIVPDIGILAGEDIVAVETAALDLIKPEDFIAGSLPAPLNRGGGGHLLEQIHGKDPYIQIEECVKLGLGSAEYKLSKVQ
ncbi:MAG: hypothetical protein AMJ81_00735 [Phycisphaerae bacterium SM23_33]|nr:MAG: hypothetical protein AMJ81_00735 [Phycisphaerae bacterium SM23_33]